MKFKNPTSNYERQLLAIVEEYRQQIEFGKISVEITIKNGRLCLVELSSIKKTLKLD
jgi:hypothetical protein